jgi:hypothetical protein
MPEFKRAMARRSTQNESLQKGRVRHYLLQPLTTRPSVIENELRFVFN